MKEGKMNSIYQYFRAIWYGFSSLWKGMMLTGHYLVHPKKILTEQYPENRDTLYIPERFQGEVVLPHDENNEHLCTGCTICEMNCPNGSIKIITQQVETPEGKKKKELDKWVYHLGLCTFCGQCIDACPQDAIKMSNAFEHSVYDRKVLTKVLNQPGSKLKSAKK
ncbi:NADH-quinone oxidoreductase subunit I [Prolixibacter sp. NT017]|nr:NADH-quinone oxidoreductase subunit I [Prolixibacter sp. NT017]